MKFLLTKILLLSSLWIGLFAQNSRLFDHITIEDGLSHSLIHAIAQDSVGFIWAATQEGLNRFDGYDITSFKINDASANSIPDNWITSLVTDREGNLWFGTRARGFSKFTSDSSKFTNYHSRLFDEFGEMSLRIQRMYITRDSILWIGSWGGGLIRYDTETDKMKQYLADPDNPNSIIENRIYTIFEDSKGYLWTSSYKSGVDRFSREDEKFVNFSVESKVPNGLEHNFIITIEEDLTGTLWFGSFGGGLYTFNRETEKFSRIGSNKGITDSLITVVFEDKQKVLWVCTDGGGLFRYNREKDYFTNIVNDPVNQRSLNDNRIWSMIEDREGALWIGTFSGGLNTYHRRKNSFNHLYYRASDKNSLSNNFVKAIYIDRNEDIWFGSNKGVDVYNKEMEKLFSLNTNDGLTSERIRFIGNFGDDEYWISTWGGGVNIFNKSSRTFSKIVSRVNDPKSLSYNFCLKVIKHTDGYYYIATETGLNRYDAETGEITVYNSTDDSTSVSSSQITDLFVDSYGNFWVGTQYGLNLFNPKKGTFKRIVSDGTNKTINNYRVGHFLQDKKGRLWVGTYGGGLNLYDYATKTFSYITEKEGLSNNSIYEILEDDSGKLWISTNRGLNEYDPETGKIRIFTSEDGLQNNEFNGGASAKSTSGLLFFGGVSGVNYFHPEKIKSNRFPPPVILVDFSVNGVKTPFIGNPAHPEEIELDFNQNFLNFTYSALEYSSPHLNKYKYMLVGLEEKWNEAGQRRTVSYTNLEPGEYVFRAIGCNGDNVWNEQGLSFAITITPPWWGTKFAKVGLVLTVLLLIIGSYNYSINKVKSNQKKLEKLVDERTKDLLQSKLLLEEAVASKDKLFSIIAHDLKNPFLPLLGYSELLANQSQMLNKEDIESSASQIHKSARALYSLLENLLDWARLQSDKIEYKPETIILQPLVDEIFSIYKVSAEQKGVMLVNNVTDEMKIIADRDMLKTVLRNTVSNSIKFCNAGDTISLKTSQDNDSCEVRILDTGVGMDSDMIKRLNSEKGAVPGKKGTNDEAGTGLGVYIVREMINKNKGKLRIFSQQGKGTEVRITLPRAK